MKTLAIAAILVTVSMCHLAQEQQSSTAPNAPPVPSKVYRVGAAVKAPQPIDTPDPKPFKNFREGIVVISCIVGSDGRVYDPRVARSLTPEADANALAAVERWKFKPATKDGVPVAVKMNIMVSYRKAD